MAGNESGWKREGAAERDGGGGGLVGIGGRADLLFPPDHAFSCLLLYLPHPAS